MELERRDQAPGRDRVGHCRDALGHAFAVARGRRGRHAQLGPDPHHRRAQGLGGVDDRRDGTALVGTGGTESEVRAVRHHLYPRVATTRRQFLDVGTSAGRDVAVGAPLDPLDAGADREREHLVGAQRPERDRAEAGRDGHRRTRRRVAFFTAASSMRSGRSL